MTFSLGGQGEKFNNIKQGHVVSSMNVRAKQVGANPQSLQVPKQGSTNVNMAGPQSVANYKAEPILASNSNGNFLKPPPVNSRPSALVQSFQQVEKTTAGALLSGGIFATMMGGPMGLGLGLGAAAAGAGLMLAEPLITGGLQKIDDAYREMTF